MIQLLKDLLAPRADASPYFHHHIDDDGRPRFCDETACRPQATRPLDYAALMLPLVR